MIRRFFLAGLLLALSAPAVFAGGAWTVRHDVQSDGALFRDVDLMQDNRIYMVGLKDTGLFTEERAWTGLLGGLIINVAVNAAYTNLCDFAYMFNSLDSTSYLDANNGVVGGGAVPESCRLLPFPYCEACLLLYEPTVFRATNGGTQIQSLVSRGQIFGGIFRIEYLTSDVVVAIGTGGTLFNSDDALVHWYTLDGPGNGTAVYTDMEFLDEEIGYLTATMTPDLRLSSRPPETIEEARERIVLLHEVEAWVKDPSYRLQAERFGDDPPLRADYGAVFWTWDHADDWSYPIFQKSGVAFLLTSWYNQTYGFVATNEAAARGDARFTIYTTHDGGTTWTAGALPATGPGTAGAYDIADIKYLSSSIGYAVGSAVDPGGQTVGFILETFDGGANWTFNTIHPAAPMTAMKFKDRTLGYLVGDKSFVAQYVGVNKPPVADAGPDQQVPLNEHVYLDGSDSSDPDDFIESYLWEQVSGPAMDLVWEDQPKAAFIAESEGVMVFKLTVTAGGQTRSDTATVTVTADDDDADDDATDDSTDDAADDADDDADDTDDGADDTGDDGGSDDDTATDDDDGDDVPNADDDADDEGLQVRGQKDTAACCG